MVTRVETMMRMKRRRRKRRGKEEELVVALILGAILVVVKGETARGRLVDLRACGRPHTEPDTPIYQGGWPP